MITERWFNLNPHPTQAALWRSPCRFKAVAAGRGSGKTEIARRYIVRMLANKKFDKHGRQIRNPLYVYALPTIPQAKKVAWPEILELVPKDWIKEINKTDLRIETKYGSTLFVVGMEKPQRVEGLQYDGVIIDESSDQKPGVFDKTFLPALSHRNGFCWRIGVPKRMGCGGPDFKSFFDRGLKNEVVPGTNMKIESYTWSSEEIVDAETIAFARANLDEKDYNEQYKAKWEDAAGRIFYSFDEVLNVDDELSYHANLPICIGSDFNVTPMAWVIGHRYANGLEIFDELFIRNTSTQETLNELFKRYGEHKAGFEFFGDATGRARKTAASSAAQSDYLIIRGDARFQNARVYYPNSNPQIVDRFASCNAMFCNMDKQRRLKVHPRCKHLIKDLLQRCYEDGTRAPDDSGDIGHITDALGYIVHRAFPLRLHRESTPNVATMNLYSDG